MLFAESRARGGGDERRGLEPLNRREKRMISRYNRRPVSHKLEIRGLSRSSLDHHPLPEEADDIETSPRYLHDLQEAASAHNSSQTSAASDHSDGPTVISVSPSQSWSGIHSSTGTGISTERSSVFSWGYDEFDKAASQQVQQMFDEIDKELYEGRGCGGGILQGLQDECQQWTTRFPHLRILGTQLLCPTDEGFQWYATPGTVSRASSLSTDRKTTVKSQGKEKGAAELNVQGRKAALIKEFNGPNSEPSSYDQPGVIEVEGVMEEYLAFDSQDLNECQEECPDSVRRHHCLPPVSPYRCRRQAVLDLLFDDAWRELVGWMKELVQRHWECCTSHDETLSGSLSPVQPDALNPFMLLSSPPAALPKLGQSRAPPLTSGQQLQNTKSRGSKHKSRWKSKKQKRPSAVCWQDACRGSGNAAQPERPHRDSQHPPAAEKPGCAGEKPGCGGAPVSQASLERHPFQQTSSSQSPGAELFLFVPPTAVGSPPKPSSPKLAAPWSEFESGRDRGIPGRGHPWDTTNHGQRPINISAGGPEPQHSSAPHRNRRRRVGPPRAAVQAHTASERPFQPRPQRLTRRSSELRTQGSSPHTRRLLSSQHDTHVQVRHSIPEFLHRAGQHRTGSARKSLCRHRLSGNRCDRCRSRHQQLVFLGLVSSPPAGAVAHQRRRGARASEPPHSSRSSSVSLLHPQRHLIQIQQAWLVVSSPPGPRLPALDLNNLPAVHLYQHHLCPLVLFQSSLFLLIIL